MLDWHQEKQLWKTIAKYSERDPILFQAWASLTLALGGSGPQSEPLFDPNAVEAALEAWCGIAEVNTQDLITSVRQLTRSKLAAPILTRPRGSPT